MSTPRESSDDRPEAGAPERPAGATPPASAQGHDRRAPADETEAADLTLAADERIQSTGDVAGMSETME